MGTQASTYVSKGGDAKETSISSERQTDRGSEAAKGMKSEMVESAWEKCSTDMLQ